MTAGLLLAGLLAGTGGRGAAAQDLDGIDARWSALRAAMIEALAEDVLADAETRASLLDAPVTGGWDDGFVLANREGTFRLRIGGELQFRYVLSDRRDGPAPRTQSGFEMRRAKVVLRGFVVDPSWTYFVRAAFDRRTGAMGLQRVTIEKALDGGVTLRMGQFKAPFLRERLVGSMRQLAVERSLVNGALGQGRSQGVQATWRSDDWSVAAMVGDGFDTTNTPWEQPTTEYAITGRVEWKPIGPWTVLRDLSSMPGDDPALLLGVAGHAERGRAGSPGAGTTSTAATADVSAEFGGATLLAMGVWRRLDGATTVDQYGALGQFGAFVTERIELFGRYEWGDLDDGGPDLSVLTGGANVYLHGNDVKVSADVGWSFEGISSGFANSGAGWRESASHQLVVRGQLQFVF